VVEPPQFKFSPRKRGKMNYTESPSKQSQGYATSAPQAIQAGITSATQDLDKEVIAISELAYNLRSALGITIPSDPQCDSKSSLLDLLQSLTYRLRSANGDLSDVLRHLTS
jgi:hypothetical protein